MCLTKGYYGQKEPALLGEIAGLKVLRATPGLIWAAACAPVNLCARLHSPRCHRTDVEPVIENLDLSRVKKLNLDVDVWLDSWTVLLMGNRMLKEIKLQGFDCPRNLWDQLVAVLTLLHVRTAGETAQL